MTTTPTLAEFLAQPYDPEEDADHTAGDRPLVRAEGVSLDLIAEALQSIITIVERQESAANAAKALLVERADLASRLEGALAEVEAKQALLDQVLEVVKPSTSKLANSVREVIAAAAIDAAYVDTAAETPAAPVIVPEEPKVEAAPAAGPVTEPAAQPQAYELGPDATVESWREYARILGHADEKVAGLNRSQIRTLLGLPHPAEGSES